VNAKAGLLDFQKKASKYLTGGMSSSFRANHFSGIPMYVDKARGPKFRDISGKEYIDFFMCHGAVLLGHDRKEINDAIIKSLKRGYFAGFDSEETLEFSKKIIDIIPCAEQLRFVNSGSEGTLLALRLARGYTGKDKIIRIDGHFHGVHDYVLANNLVTKIDLANDGTRISKVVGRTAGIPDIVDKVMVTVPWNNIDTMEKVFKDQAGEIGGIIMNIIDYNNGCITTTKEYLQAVRNLADRYEVVLIFDEILSGFKTGLSCGQGYYGVTPDICTLGKALTNDVPLGVVAGKKEIMDKIMDPEDPVIAGGTFSGNQLGIAAGIASLNILSRQNFYDEFLSRAEKFYTSLQELFVNKNIPASVQYLGAGFSIYLGVEKQIKCYSEFKNLDPDLGREFFISCIEHGLYFHTDFTISAAHDEVTLGNALDRFETVMNKLRRV